MTTLKPIIPAEMRLTAIVQALLEEQEWNDDIQLDLSNKNPSLRCRVRYFGIVCQLHIEADEQKEWLSVVLRAQLKIPARRLPQACQLMNVINLRGGIGSFAADCRDSFQFRQTLDLAGAQATVVVLRNAVDAGLFRLRDWWVELIKLVLTNMRVAAILAERDAIDARMALDPENPRASLPAIIAPISATRH